MQTSNVTILGSNSAISVFDRFPSGQVLQVENHHILIDCGEGTQFRMSQYGIKKSKINTILISHLHGDHVFGLPGLLTSFQLAGRREPLTIYGPSPLQEYLDMNLGGTGHFIDYPLEIIELDKEDISGNGKMQIAEMNDCIIEAFELIHRIDCFGYKISEKPKKQKMRPEFLEQYNPDIKSIRAIKKGADYITNAGELVPNADCAFPAAMPRSYAYCSDTIFHIPLKEILLGTSTIYHESTYLQDLHDKAASRFHSTAKEAAEIAKGAEAEQLILGHFSSRYKDLEPFRNEAMTIFANVEIAVEGKVFQI